MNGDVKHTVYYDLANKGQVHDVILCVINRNGERIGENSGDDSDVKIVTDNILAIPALDIGYCMVA